MMALQINHQALILLEAIVLKEGFDAFVDSYEHSKAWVHG